MKKQLLTVCALALLVFAAAPSQAFDGDISIFADQGLSICQATVNCGGPPLTLFVYGLMKGASAQGITGAEFAISESNPGGFLIATSLAHVIGEGATNVGLDALSNQVNGGVNIAWPGCQTGDNGGNTVLLATLSVVSLGTNCGEENQLTVVRKDQNSNSFFQCPLFTLCDAPAFTKVCLGFDRAVCANQQPPFANDATCSTSGGFLLNPPPGFNCTVAVTEATWSGVKSLYN